VGLFYFSRPDQPVIAAVKVKSSTLIDFVGASAVQDEIFFGCFIDKGAIILWIDKDLFIS